MLPNKIYLRKKNGIGYVWQKPPNKIKLFSAIFKKRLQDQYNQKWAVDMLVKTVNISTLRLS